MERLTEILCNEFGYCIKCSETCANDSEMCIHCPEMEKLVNRLGAYEDTGLTPEEVISLQAKSKEVCRPNYEAEYERLRVEYDKLTDENHYLLNNILRGKVMDDNKILEKKVAREILSIIEEICFSRRFFEYRLNWGSNGTRDLIL